MADVKTVIPIVRDSVAAVFRLRLVKPQKVKKGKVIPAQYQCSWGSAFCVVTNKFIITAFHVLNAGKPRNLQDKFYALVVPGNGSPFFYFPVIAFPIEDQNLDIAILEIGPCAKGNIHLPALPITFTPQIDGTRVVTVGFPSPEVKGISADAKGNFLGGQFFLKSHANEGIISAQYVIGSVQTYELNVGWHHGESGGPIVTISEKPTIFSLMQHYRSIQGPHGILPGPHVGRALSAIQQQLINLGVTIN